MIQWRLSNSCLTIFILYNLTFASSTTVTENVIPTDDDGDLEKRAARPFTSSGDFDSDILLIPEGDAYGAYQKRGDGFADDMPGVLRFGKRSQSFIRFGRSGVDELKRLMDKKQVPGVLRFGKRSSDIPGVLRFGKRSDMPGVLRFGKRSFDDDGIQEEKKAVPGVLRFGKRSSDMPGVLRFGKRSSDMPGVLRFGKRFSDMPGVLRFGKRSDMPGVLRFGKRFEISFLDKKSEMPGVLRFGRK